MKPRAPLTVALAVALALAGLVVWGLMSQQGQSNPPQKPLNPQRDWEAFVQRQVEEQTARREYPLRLELDFSPFEAELSRLGEARAGELQALTQASTLAELRAEMEAGRVSSEELTLFYLARIRRHNDRLGAYLTLNPAALQEARERDREQSQGRPRGPLHGLPVTLKDNIATQGPMPTTAGAAVLAGVVADREAFIVTRLKEAGAVILGKNNLSEWANFMTSTSVNGYSALGGHTRNPHGPFDVGGSSSGTAAAVAANLAAAGVGSETSGSLVYPAAQNGVFTLKPTFGLVSRDRIIPISEVQDTAGPLVRRAADLEVLMNVLAAHDPNDPVTEVAKGFPGRDGFEGVGAEAARGKPLRIGWVQHAQREGDEGPMRAAVEALRGLGAEVVEVPYPQGQVDMLPVLRYGLREGVKAYLEATGAPVKDLAAVAEFNAQNAQAAPYGQDLLVLSRDETLTEAEYQALVERNRKAGTEALEGLMREHNVSVLLTVSNSLSLFTSTSGYPVLNLPAGRRETGEPVGASLVGRPLEDLALIRLAVALSERLPATSAPELR